MGRVAAHVQTVTAFVQPSSRTLLVVRVLLKRRTCYDIRDEDWVCSCSRLQPAPGPTATQNTMLSKPPLLLSVSGGGFVSMSGGMAITRALAELSLLPTVTHLGGTPFAHPKRFLVNRFRGLYEPVQIKEWWF